VLPHQLQHPEAWLRPVAGPAAHQAVVDQHAERVDHVTVRPDRLDGLERHPAVEDREPCEQALLRRSEQVQAPVDRRGNRLLPVREVASGGGRRA
jgi:hypothetical protein